MLNFLTFKILFFLHSHPITKLAKVIIYQYTGVNGSNQLQKSPSNVREVRRKVSPL